MRAEIATLSSAIDRAERVACVGASGSGKTSVIRELLEARRGIKQRGILFDPFRELRGVSCFTLCQALSVFESSRYARVRVETPSLFSELIFLGLQGENCFFVADEAQLLLPSSGRSTDCSEALLSLVTTGRHSNCPLIWATQSPGRCSYSLTDNSTGARVIGNLSSNSSLQRVTDWGVERQDVTSLKPHELLLSVPAAPVRRFYSVKM
jgi:ABC-type dipeptide/oligopeptide/nickel transport system ATPase component